MPVVALNNLTRSYGSRRGIEDVDLAVHQGALFGFLGPNGAGKSTAIRVMLGFLQPTSGAAKILGRDCWQESHIVKRDIGYLPGDLRLYHWLTGVRAISIWSSMRGIDLSSRARALASRLDLDLTVRVRAMSRGMRQKLGLILALAHDPAVIVLDEPTSGLDPLMQAELHRILRERAAHGATVFFSSHTLSEVEVLCDRVAIIRQGRIVADERLETLRSAAGRQVTIHWSDGQAARIEEPPGWRRIDRGARRWHGLYQGDTRDLITFLQDKPIADIVIESPDLEALFKQYYESDESPAGERKP